MIHSKPNGVAAMSRAKMDARELFLKFSLVSVNFLALLSISLFSRTGDCDGVCFSPVGSGRQQQRTTSPSLVEPKVRTLLMYIFF